MCQLSITRIHVAPLGLGCVRIRCDYTHTAPLGLWVGQDARPTGIGFNPDKSGFHYAQPVGRDSYLDTPMSILENRPTEVRNCFKCIKIRSIYQMSTEPKH